MSHSRAAEAVRAERLASQLTEGAYQALLITASSGRDPDLAPFVGAVKLGESLLVLRPGEEPRLAYLSPMDRDGAAHTGLSLLEPELLDVGGASQKASSPSEFLGLVIRRALEVAAVPPGRVALAGHAASGTVHEACKSLEAEGWCFDAGHELVLGLRKTKTDAELHWIRRAAEGTMQAFRRVAEDLAAARCRDGELWLAGERLTVSRLRAALSDVLAGCGLEQPEGNIVAPAEESAVPHNPGTPDRVLRAAESLVVDLFPRDGLFADCTRTFCVGEASEALQKAHGAVLAALEAAHLTRPGTSGWELQKATCERLARLGYPTPITDPGTLTGYVHGLGHGVGFELHEYPSFRERQDDNGTLAVGDVLTLEPGLYDEVAGFGVRLEDLCLLGEGGIEILTPLPYALDPREWVE